MKNPAFYLLAGILIGAALVYFGLGNGSNKLELYRIRSERANAKLDSLTNLSDSLRLVATTFEHLADSAINVADSLQIIANRRPTILTIYEQVDNWGDSDRDQFWFDEAERSIHTP